jgi:hypothetical protein
MSRRCPISVQQKVAARRTCVVLRFFAPLKDEDTLKIHASQAHFTPHIISKYVLISRY